ncbi:GNAT family N-acetyltransferase [Flavobacteriaceae bacterium XHP0103]|uniref:GNAT family N-acetyltransferase n=1 Tax=Marixanthotalea marina TaxID=2844359 RepID=UPI002989B20F|nr:GNAT family N-acetyltransferase [Marixanthotalea marina]MBU3822329.1 GNAT family N-acetyltransferase [Marixanthotalea marina]
MIELKELTTKSELKAFVKFPFKLYKGSKYWVPPIISEEVKTLNKDVNPAFKDANARFFMAYKNGEPVGRIAAIINWIEVNKQNHKKMRFGWFDVIDDIEVSKILLNKVLEIGKENNLKYIEGPVGFSNLDKVGVLTEGFDEIGNMITWHNHEYYANHFKGLGFQVAKKYSENKMDFKQIKPDSFEKIQDLIKRRYQLKALSFTNNKDIMPYTDEMFEVFSKSHKVLSSFVDINEEQKAYFKKKFIGFLSPEYVKFVLDKDDKLIGFGIVTPSYAEALQKMNGKLFPFGIWHLLQAKKHAKTVTFYLIGVLPEYQNKGITAVIFNEFYKTFKEKGIETCIRGPELDDNVAIHQIWKHFNPVTHKRRCTFKKDIA